MSSLHSARRLARGMVVQRPRLAHLEGYLYLLPAVALIGVWLYWPLLATLQLSFVQWNLLPTVPRRPVG